MNRYEPASFKKHEVRMQELRNQRKSEGLPQIFSCKSGCSLERLLRDGSALLVHRNIEKHSGVALQTWLSSLEARIRFREIGSINLLTTGGRSSGDAT